MAQVVTISATGAVSCLQAKPGKGADFRSLGRASIVRASEIRWDQTEQGWFVHILRGKYQGAVISHLTMAEVTLDTLPVKPRARAVVGASGTVAEAFLWDDYDDAVRAEIAFLDHVRRTEGADAVG